MYMRCICMRDCLGYSLDLVKTGCTGNLKKFEITI